jgi:hypothetical protein
MGDGVKTKRTTIYIPISLWEQLRWMALRQHDTANNIVVALLKNFLQNVLVLPETRKQPQIGGEGMDIGVQRTLRIPEELFDQIEQAIKGKTTFSNLVQTLVRNDLERQASLLPSAQEQARPTGPASVEKERVSAYIAAPKEPYVLNLGEKPFHIDLNSGEISTEKGEEASSED